MLQIMDRNTAHAAGLLRFFTGRPCKYGHLTERYVSTGACLDCLTRKALPQSATARFIPMRPIYMGEATSLEAQAVFGYVEASGWYTAALKAIRENPTLLAHHTATLTGSQRANLEAADIGRRAALKHLLG